MNGNGTSDAPYNNINTAKIAVRNLHRNNKYPEGGVVIKLAEGDFMPEDFLLGSHKQKYLWLQGEYDYGKENAPLVFEGDGNVRFIGGIKADLSEFEPTTEDDLIYGAGIVKYQAPEGTFAIDNLPLSGSKKPETSQVPHNATPYFSVFFDEEYMTLSRWPNEGYVTVSDVLQESSLAENKGFEITSESITQDKLNAWSDENIIIHGYWNVDYHDFGTPATVTENGLMSLYPAGENAYGETTGPVKGGNEGRRFYVENSPSELDTPGEWYIDNENDVLYFYPTKDSGEVIISTSTDNMIKADATDYITLKNIKIIGGRARGITVNNSEGFVIDGCTVNGSGTKGINISASILATVKNSHIYNTGNGGIVMVGGSRRTNGTAYPKSGRNTVINNEIHDFSKVNKCYAYGIELGGYRNVVENNEIYNAPHMAIYVGGWNLAIRYNDIHDVLTETSDMGAIYTGMGKSRRGNVIEYNYFHDLKTSSVLSEGRDISAIFMDDVSDGYTVRYNIFRDINGRAFRTNGGRDHTVTNNVFVNVHTNTLFTRSTGKKYQDAIYSDPAISSGEYRSFTEYPHLTNLLEDDPIEPKYNVFKDNYSYGEIIDLRLAASGIDDVRDYMVNELGCEFENSTKIDRETCAEILLNDYSRFGIDFSKIGVKQ